MKILALIPARGGSKRLPGKNIRLLGGKPLIIWSIDVAKGMPEISDILVSTDDPSIATVCKEAGTIVPWLRPAELATDIASSVDVVLHALDWYEAEKGPVDAIILLQPTSPLRTVKSIRRAVAMFTQTGGRQPVVSVSPASSHPDWCFRTTATSMEPYMGWGNLGKRSQDQELAWALNGAIYIISPDRLREERTFVTTDAQPFHMSDMREAIDIDDEIDFKLCETYIG